MEFIREHHDSCPGEEECASTKNRPIYSTLVQINTARTLAKAIQNPPRKVVESCCKSCPLFPSKPGNETEDSLIIEATNAGLHLERLLEKGLGGIVFRSNCPNPRKIAAWEGILNARSKSEGNMMKEGNTTPDKPELGDIE